MALSACTTAFDANRATLEAMHAAGAYAQAAAMLDDPAQKDLYADKNRLLYWLDRGAIALALGDTDRAIELLEKAEASMETFREPTGGEELSTWLLNDTAKAYYGEPYEEIYVNVLKMLAQLEAGRIENGATVEARRAAGKADVLRDRYVRTRESTAATGDDRFRQTLATTRVGGLVDANDQGEFIESTLGDLLSAVAFCKNGDVNDQVVAGRRLGTAIDLQRTLQGGQTITEAAFRDVGSLRPEEFNVLVVGLSGRAPTMVARRVGPIPVYEWPVYFELPELQGGSEEVASVRLICEPVEVEGNVSGVAPAQLAKIEDLRAVAYENHRRQLPLIYTRTLLRSQLKAAAWFAASEAVRRSSSRGSSRDLATVGMVLGGLAFVGLTEKADLRCWEFLPGRADAALVRLPAGRYRVHLEYLAANGGVLYFSPTREITAGASPDDLTTVVEHFWR
ncbi:MAG TPA: hypothetical protein VHC70_04520 [Phycisphaerales bacterium]|nr:hypothetical protein [Phycisphaerales bacterium]